jgi:HlyD family secretion protein
VDVIRQKDVPSSRKLLLPVRWILIIAAAVLVIAAFMSRANVSGNEIKREALVIGVVKQGTFNVSVDGYGTLRSNSKRLITSVMKATVEEIVLKPGAKVEPDSIILRLSNPTIDQELDLARQQWEAEKTTVEEMALTQQRELRDEDVALARTQSALELAELKKEAFAKLANEGIVSKIDYAEINLQVRQLRGDLNIQRERYKTLQQINRKKIDIHGRLVAQRKLSYETVLERKDKLLVKAGEQGVLQTVFVELGQNIEAGAQLALVGGSLDLNALIKIPQSKVDLVQIGQKARISVGNHDVRARVVQINPGVVDGSVTIELLPEEPLPSNARPDLNVDASIDVGSYERALFVERPANVRPNSLASVFRLDGDEERAEAVPVRFGNESGRMIQIESGLTSNAKIVLTDMSKYNSDKTLRIEK